MEDHSLDAKLKAAQVGKINPKKLNARSPEARAAQLRTQVGHIHHAFPCYDS